MVKRGVIMETKTLILKRWGVNHPMTFTKANYNNNNNLYVGLLTNIEGYPEPWSDLTVNLGVECADNCAFIDVNNNGDDIIDWLCENNLGKLTGSIYMNGFCIYPEFEFNMDRLRKFI